MSITESRETDNRATQHAWFGQMLDADGHFYIEPDTYDDLFLGLPVGVGGMVMDYLRTYQPSEAYRHARSINREQFWETKGLSALGAFDPRERVEALDRLGVSAQLVFPNTPGDELRVDQPWARDACERFNDFALLWAATTGWRARAVCQINMGDHEWAFKELDRVIARGAKAVLLPCNRPPGGVSPSHSLWDPLWARLEEADIPATIHLAGAGLLMGRDGDEMLPDRGWGDSEILKRGPGQRLDIPLRAGGEEAISPYFMLIAHMAPELMLQTMVMGGVFERFPGLRFGIIEFGAGWLGPAVERMDIWVDFQAKIGVKYPMRPSEYVQRNVRVTPFWHENLARMIERFGLEDVYMYSTDYPHLEGSKDPIGKFQRWLDELGDDYPEKFFVQNARLLMPQ